MMMMVMLPYEVSQTLYISSSARSSFGTGQFWNRAVYIHDDGVVVVEDRRRIWGIGGLGFVLLVRSTLVRHITYGT